MAPKRDSKGHMMALWDEHPACRNCLRQLGIFCTRATPCSVCAKWDEATWKRSERAIQEKERQKAKSAEVAKPKRADSSSSETPFTSPLAKKSKRKGEGGSSARQTDIPLAAPSRIPVSASGSDPGPSAKPAHVTKKPKASTDGPAAIPLQQRPAQQPQAPDTQAAVAYQLSALDQFKDPQTGSTVQFVPFTSSPLPPAPTDQSFMEMFKVLTQQVSELRTQQQSTELQLKVAQLSQQSTQPAVSQLSQPQSPHSKKKKRKHHRSSSSSSRSDRGNRRSKERDRNRRSPARASYSRSSRRSVFDRLGCKSGSAPSDRYSSHRSSSDRNDRRRRRTPTATVTRSSPERRRDSSLSPPRLKSIRS